MDSYKQLAYQLDSLPQGFPATESGVELRILQLLFSPEEASLASKLQSDPETPSQIAARCDMDTQTVYPLLKEMSRKGLIKIIQEEGHLKFGLMPFVVGFYEMQGSRMNTEFAQLVEEYFKTGFEKVVKIQPQFHRVIPVRKSVSRNLEIHPYESAAQIIENAKSWGVTDCICRVQKKLIGEPCSHPIDVCMILSQSDGAFDNSKSIRTLTKEEALATLDRAADAGLVHSVSNYQEDFWYICNCCTCACGILRSMKDFGLANVIARSSFVNQVIEEDCTGCGSCVDFCYFGALSVDLTAHVNQTRCVGCGVCVDQCPSGALHLVNRPAEEVKPTPRTEKDWLQERASLRHTYQ
jgi:electron transport complex protein RnfB